MRLKNPVESLDNVEKPEKYRTHGTRIDKLVRPGVVRSLGELRDSLQA